MLVIFNSIAKMIMKTFISETKGYIFQIYFLHQYNTFLIHKDYNKFHIEILNLNLNNVISSIN